MYCPKCGAQNSENAAVCLSCGQPLTGLSQTPQTPAKTSTLAIWSFVLAMIGLFTFMITALPALICGIVSLVKISNSKGQLKGTGFAVAGIAIPSIGGIFILPMMLAILMPALARANVVAQRTMCATNLKHLGVAMIVYTKNHNDTYPPAENWQDLLIKNCNVNPKQFCCPASKTQEGQSSYAININVAGKKVSQVPPDTVLLFETTPGANPAGGPEILTTENHRGELCNILFADDRVRFVKTSDLSTLRWNSE